jgi:transcriptional regulator with XRE-family HTH domain
MKRFGEKLRALRKQRGLTMNELAPELGFTSQSYLSEIETGKKKPSIDLIIRIARYFDVSLDQLMLDELDLDEDYC